MPAIVGALRIQSVGTSSIIHVGDVYSINSYSEAKTFAGGGSFNTGDAVTVQIDHAQTAINDNDKFDQVMTGMG
ncbi:spore germination protein PA [Amphibacillus marinus]|uniref:Spore germination protein PA n=1 Tax=Amphibacillus marinus TaxID=872970 RepID=A0A1H8Q7R1_9BACI|nr:spore germination protein [Amphibacillus marinus]SEO50011.1 spore germination protein PA [Amphibacillus marinus]